MRGLVGSLGCVLMLTGFAGGQNLTEFAAGAATGSTGGAAGKKVSDGISSIFGKVNQQTQTAATQGSSNSTPQQAKPEPAAEASAAPASSAPKQAARRASAKPSGSEPAAEPNSVPDPPPSPGEHVAGKPSRPLPPPQPVAVLAPPAPPPPPAVTREDLQNLATGAKRDDVLKLGAPASRLSMFDDGHLVEVYTYTAGDSAFGVVRLTDGAVSRVDLR